MTTANRNAGTPRSISPRLKIARSDLATAFLRAVSETGSSQEKAARAMGVAKRTVGAWMRGERSMNVEVVLATPRLGHAFRVALCAHKHEEPLAYVASKGRR